MNHFWFSLMTLIDDEKINGLDQKFSFKKIPFIQQHFGYLFLGSTTKPSWQNKTFIHDELHILYINPYVTIYMQNVVGYFICIFIIFIHWNVTGFTSYKSTSRKTT